MDTVSQLVIAALFSLHQYLPADKLGVKYFETTLDPVTLSSNANGLTIVASAHQTCRALFQSGGAELDMNEEQILGFAHTLINDKEGRLVDAGSSPAAAKETLRRVCQPDFDPQSFTKDELRQIEEFVQQKVAILKESDLESTGSYQYFGRVNLYDRNGKDMGPLFSLTEHWIAYPEISPFTVNALVSAEDEHFFKHEGVHLDSLVRMVYKMQTTDESKATGGSTLTMQLLKNLYFNDWKADAGSVFEQQRHLKTMLRKVREWYWAKPYELHHEKLGPGSGKRFVLENYLNLMDFGPGVRGIDQAAAVFFKKEPRDLTLAESAFVASLFKAPNRYARPSNYDKYTLPRRKYVLDQMRKVTFAEHGIKPITQKDADTAQASELPQWEGNIPSTANDTLSNLYIRTFAKDFLHNNVQIPEGKRALESEFVTTIDADLQKVVFDVVREKVDAYDSKRTSLNLVGPARDDRSQVALPKAEDIPADADEALLTLKDKLDELQIHVQLSVYLGETFSTEDKKQVLRSYYNLKGRNGELPANIISEVQSSYSSQSRFVGQLLVSEVSSTRCQGLDAAVVFKSVDDVMAKTTPTTEIATEQAPIIETVQTENVVVPFELEEKTPPSEFPPIPTFKPDNWEEIVAAARAYALEHMFSELPIQIRPSYKIPFLPTEPVSCARLLSANEIERLGLGTLFSQTEDTVSKHLVKTALARMSSLSPREGMYPAIIDGRSNDMPLVVAPELDLEDPSIEYSHWVRPIALAAKDAKHISKKLNKDYRTGNIFWISQEGDKFELGSPKLQAAIVAMNSETGEVLANFGGYNPTTSKFFDRSRLAKRQAGSTLKPWLYYLALNKGLQPYDMIRNNGVVFKMKGQKDYSPDNFSKGGGSDYVMLETAFINSQNKPALGLLTDERFGFDQEQNLREFLGLLTDVEIYQKDTVQFVASTALGAQELRIIDLVSSFTFFANGQKIAKPQFFTSLVNGHGEKLYNEKNTSISVPYQENTVPLFQMQTLLMKVANNGTAAKLRGLPEAMGLDNCNGRELGITQNCFGGKTGTSNDSKDNWFIGFSRNFVIGVWVGYDYPASTNATGGELALPIFMDIVKNGKDHLPAIEPIISSAPAGMKLIHVGKDQSCQTDAGAGTPIFVRSDAAELPRCRVCFCQSRVYAGNDLDYTLMVDGFSYQDFATTDDGSNDAASCQATKAQVCQ